MDPLFYSATISGKNEENKIITGAYTNGNFPTYSDFVRIDRVFGLFDCIRERLNYVSLNNGRNGFDVYVHLKTSYNCIVFSLSFDPYDFSTTPGFTFNPRTFTITSGDGGTNDVRKEKDSFIEQFFRSRELATFVVAGLPKGKGFLEANLEVALTCLQEGGNAVFEVDDPTKRRDVLLKYSKEFRETNLFKPITSDLSSPSCYFVCVGKAKSKGNPSLVESYLKELKEFKSRPLPNYNQALIYAGCRIVK
jgi:hypothetical protein